MGLLLSTTSSGSFTVRILLGRSQAFVHVEKSQAFLILQICKLVKNCDGPVSVEDAFKVLKKMSDPAGFRISRSKDSLQRISDKMAGFLWIDVRGADGKYHKLMDNVVDVQKGIYHKKRNLPKCPKYLKAPILFVAART